MALAGVILAGVALAGVALVRMALVRMAFARMTAAAEADSTGDNSVFEAFDFELNHDGFLGKLGCQVASKTELDAIAVPQKQRTCHFIDLSLRKRKSLYFR